MLGHVVQYITLYGIPTYITLYLNACRHAPICVMCKINMTFTFLSEIALMMAIREDMFIFHKVFNSFYPKFKPKDLKVDGLLTSRQNSWN